MCAKGWIQMRWATESEPHGDFIIGERAHEFVRDRLEERQARWDYVNAKVDCELSHRHALYPAQYERRLMVPMMVVALVDDGMFRRANPGERGAAR